MADQPQPHTIVGCMLSINGITIFRPPRRINRFGKRIKNMRYQCAPYFAVPRSKVVLVTKSHEHVLVESAAQIEAVLRKRQIWYVLAIRSDVLETCMKSIPVIPAAQL